MKFFGLAMLSVQLVSCGMNTDNIDVLNSTNIPTLGPFTSSGMVSGNLGTGFTTSTPYWIFSSAIAYGSYFAPARGIVTEVGSSTLSSGASFITIVHSSRLATVVHGLQLINVRPGDAVLEGSSVGSFLGGSSIAFQVLLDGTPVCPLSFLSATLRSSFVVGAFNPCQ